MSETDDIEEIRRQRREELEREMDEDDDALDDPVHVTGADHLNRVVADNDVVLVDFHADWCGPCQMLEPIVESLAAETPAVVAQVDVDANQALASQYGVRGVPMLLLFADGETVEQMVGVQEKDRLASLIEQYA